MHQLGVVLGRAEVGRHAGGQRVLHSFGHAEQHRRAEDARRDGHASDVAARCVAIGSVMPTTPPLTRRGGSADLAVVGGHLAVEIHDTPRSPWTPGLRRRLRRRGGSCEAAHQIDGDRCWRTASSACAPSCRPSSPGAMPAQLTVPIRPLTPSAAATPARPSVYRWSDEPTNTPPSSFR